VSIFFIVESHDLLVLEERSPPLTTVSYLESNEMEDKNYPRKNKEENPFEYDSPVNEYELAKITFFFGSLLIFVRIILVALCVFVAIVVSHISLLGLSADKTYQEPLSPIRRKLLSPIRYLSRAILFVMGFYYIEVTGEPSDKAAFITPNHCSLFDSLVLIWLCMPSPVAKAEVTKIPLVSVLLRAIKLIPLKRESKEARNWTKNVMSKFSKSASNHSYNKFPPVLIFPQGTTTKVKTLSMFQRGAFLPGLPVQGVALNYKWKHFDPAFVVTRSKDYFFRRHWCQFYYSLQVTFLPLHVPNKEEIDDPTLFANAVRQEIADILGATTTEHYFEDAKLFKLALKLKEDMNVLSLLQRPEASDRINLAGFEITQVKNLLSSDTVLKDVEAALRVFVKMDLNHDGFIDYYEFCAATGYNPEMEQSRIIFAFFDRDLSGTVDFKELTVGMALCSSKLSLEEKARFAFDLYDSNRDGLVSGKEITSFAVSSTRNILNSTVQSFLRKAEEAGAPKDKDGEVLLDWPLFKQLVSMDQEPNVVDIAIEKTMLPKIGRP